MPTRIAGFTLTRRPGSAQWCRTWYDPSTRSTRRASLRTSDLREAERRLAEYVAGHADLRDQDAASMPLATVLTRYWSGHACRLPSAGQARIELRMWSDFFTTDMVADLTPTRQEQFVQDLRGKGYSGGYISRILSSGRAAIRRAHKRGELLQAPFVLDVETSEDRRLRDPKGRRITIQEMARLFDHADLDHVRMFVMLACCTLARPAAILDLTVFQRDRENGTIDLNPAGRRQTKKFRPVVLEPDALTEWLDQAKGPHFVQWRGKRIGSIKSAWRKLRADAGLDDRVTPYSIRHTMNRELKRRGVPREQRSGMLGHLPTGPARTTAIYEDDDPAYLSDAVAAIDQVMVEIGRAATRPIVPSIVLSVVSSSASKVVGAAGFEPATSTMST